MLKSAKVFFLTLFIWQHLAESEASDAYIRHEINEILKKGKAIDQTLEKVRGINFLSSNIRVPIENRAYLVEGLEFINGYLRFSLYCCESNVHIEMKFPISETLQADCEKYSLYLDSKLNTRLYLSNLRDYQIFLATIKDLKRLLKLQELCFQKIFYETKTTDIPQKFFKRLGKQQRKILKKAKIRFLVKKLKDLFACYAEDHDMFNSTRKRRGSFEAFDNLARNFFRLIEEEPQLLSYIELEYLTNFIKQVAVQSAGIEVDISENFEEMFLKHQRTILKMLKEYILQNGAKIKFLHSRQAIYNKETIIELLRFESDIMYFAKTAEEVEIRNRQDDYINPSTGITENSYNFNDVKYIAQTHVFLLINLLKKVNPTNWLLIINDLLDDDTGTLMDKTQFSLPAGRWLQSGIALEGHLKIAQKIKNSPEMSRVRKEAEAKATELFESDHLYGYIMRELALPMKGYDLSYVEILSMICPMNLKRCLDQFKRSPITPQTSMIAEAHVANEKDEKSFALSVNNAKE